ncbi:endospore germination permease [Paenibacillus sp. HJGM_3]|uniref:GerAB/ArcD/ProY family transporter n=1 Tax=Paenibacillus sp. HJGM_3 TaxID=3379816 RepID=UPI00385EFEF7
MLETGKISLRQFTIMVLFVTVGESILIIPGFTAVEAKQDAWLSGLIAMPVGLFAVYIYGTVGRLYPRLTLIEMTNKILGTWIGTIVSLLFLLLPFYNISGLVRLLSDFISTQIMPETPFYAIHVLFIGVIVIAARLGLEPTARAAEIFLPWFLLLFLGFVVFLFPQMDVKKLQPVLEDGIKPALRGSIANASFPYMELVSFMMIFPFVNRADKVRKHFVVGALLGGLILVITITVSLLVLGVETTALNLYPSYTLGQKISIGRFIERVEAIMAVMWILTLFMKVTVYVIMIQLMLGQLFKLKQARALALPIGFFAIGSGIAIAPNITVFNHVAAMYWPFFSASFGVGLPVLLLIVYSVRRMAKSS